MLFEWDRTINDEPADLEQIELAVVYFFYIETRYTPLEEIAKYFDGDAALLGGAAGTSKGNMLAAKLDGADGDEKRPYEVEHKEL